MTELDEKNKLEEVIFKALKNSDEICKYRNYNCRVNENCEKCIKNFLNRYKKLLNNAEN